MKEEMFLRKGNVPKNELISVFECFPVAKFESLTPADFYRR